MSGGGYGAIDLSGLQAPDMVEALSYEQILTGMIDRLKIIMPEFDALLESDPAIKVLEVAAYRELYLRQRVNDAARAVMLAHAQGTDLDHLAALFGVQRNIIDPGDPDHLPPIAPTYEEDESLRRRTQLSLEGQTVAGSEGSYIFHALAVAGVKDVSVSSPAPGKVMVTVLSLSDQGVADAELLEAVKQTLSAKDVRPLTDQVTVQSATIIEYAIEAQLTIGSGPDAAVVLEAARDAVAALAEANHRLGQDVNVSAIYAALHKIGVNKVVLTSPETIVVPPDSAAYCTNINVTKAGG